MLDGHRPRQKIKHRIPGPSQVAWIPIAIVIATLFHFIPAAQAEETISIAGSWRFLMNGPKCPDIQGALPTLNFTDAITLPGTTESSKKGPEQSPGWVGQLSRLYRYDGAAWYQRDIDIPPQWRNKRISLFLERTKYSQLWLDAKPMGEGNIFCTPQEFPLGTLEPGKHTITLCVDNTRLPVKADAHQWSDNTQTNWNGIIGRIELQATDPIWLDDVQAYPSAVNRTVAVRVHIAATQPGHGQLIAHATGPGVSNASRTKDVSWTEDGADAQIDLSLGSTAAVWDEFHPNLLHLVVTLANSQFGDQRKLSFGLRDFAVDKQHFTINGRPTFLRGKHLGCVFPLTGYPPMDTDGWLKYLRICKQYGINQIRCHTFVPPEAAFAAADEVGIYLQPELPFWGDFDDTVKAAMEPEAKRVLKLYGNHPSFVMFTMGNENRGSRDVIASLVDELRKQDNRHLYAQGSNAFLWDPQLPPGDDFLISAKVKAGSDSPLLPVRGSFADIDGNDGFVQYGPPNTMTDYSDAASQIPKPVVGHEVGQYTVYPDFREIQKYTGVTRATNLQHFRDRLKSTGMFDQADDFFRASGALAAICYRQEIEAALRTSPFGGFQLLDLQDYPGQGTALVGILDSFMDSKEIIAPEQWRQFCAPLVLLARFEKFVWTSDEQFHADVSLAHYGESDLQGAVLDWQLADATHHPVASGKFDPVDVPQGGVRDLARLDFPLSVANAPGRLDLQLWIEKTDIHTSYPLWVYPQRIDTSLPNTVALARDLKSALHSLSLGRHVILIPDESHPLVHTVGGGFATDFWCWPMFHDKPGTMGILCDPGSSVLKNFPTESHSDWQWFNIASHAQPLILDDFPPAYRPAVQVIDNLERVHRLGLIFEVNTDPGYLLICASDLIALEKTDPAARQLLASLIRYAATERFAPQTRIDLPRLKELLMTRIRMNGSATASSFDPGWQNFKPSRAVDANDYTQWTAAKDSRNPWWQFSFNEPTDLNGAEILFGDDNPGWSYKLETSTNGHDFHAASDQTHNSYTTGRHRLQFSSHATRAVRITITSAPGNKTAAIREVWFF